MNKLMAPSSSNVEMMRAVEMQEKCGVRVCSSLLMLLLVTFLCQH